MDAEGAAVEAVASWGGSMVRDDTVVLATFVVQRLTFTVHSRGYGHAREAWLSLIGPPLANS